MSTCTGQLDVSLHQNGSLRRGCRLLIWSLQIFKDLSRAVAPKPCCLTLFDFWLPILSLSASNTPSEHGMHFQCHCSVLPAGPLCALSDSSLREILSPFFHLAPILPLGAFFKLQLFDCLSWTLLFVCFWGYNLIMTFLLSFTMQVTLFSQQFLPFVLRDKELDSLVGRQMGRGCHSKFPRWLASLNWAAPKLWKKNSSET